MINSLDFKLDFGVVSERLVADLSGNACCGWSSAATCMVALATVDSKPGYRIRRPLAVEAPVVDERKPEKHKSSALDALLGM
jgi:hypothetical protein